MAFVICVAQHSHYIGAYPGANSSVSASSKLNTRFAFIREQGRTSWGAGVAGYSAVCPPHSAHYHAGRRAPDATPLPDAAAVAPATHAPHATFAVPLRLALPHRVAQALRFRQVLCLRRRDRPRRTHDAQKKQEAPRCS